MAGHGSLAAALLTDSLGNGLFVPFSLVYFLKTTSLGLSAIGLSLSVAGFAALVAVPASGQLVDRFGAVPAVIAGNLASAAAFTGYLGVTSAWQLAGLAFLAASGGRFFWTANLALVGEAFGGEERTRWFAVQRTMRNAGFGVGGLMAAAAVAGGSRADYRLLAAGDAASFALAALLMFRWSRRHKGLCSAASGADGQRTQEKQPGYRAALADRSLLRLAALNLMFVLAMMAPQVLLTVYLVRDLHRSAWLAGVLFALNTALVMGCQLVVSRAAGRLRQVTVLRLAALGWTVSFLLLWTLRALPAAAVVPGAIGAIVMFSGAEMLQGPELNTMVIAAAPAARRGRYLAVYQLSWAIGRAAAPGLLSWLLAIGPGWPWATLIAACIIALLLSWRVPQTKGAKIMGNTSPRVLVIENSPTAGIGNFRDWLQREGLVLEIRRPHAGDPVPAATGASGLIVLGGPTSAQDDDRASWLPATRGLLRHAVAAGTPTLGICLGAQLLAVACGGQVELGRHGHHIGAVEEIIDVPDDPLMTGLLSPAPFVHWHHDAISLPPPGSAVLAHSDTYGCQAFRVGSRAWGVVFHPEATFASMENWAALHALSADETQVVMRHATDRRAEIAAASETIATNFAGIVRAVAKG